MTYARIMVHTILDSSNASVLSVAASLAERTKASVVGIAASALMPVIYDEGFANAVAIDADLTSLVHATAEAQAHFRAAMAGRCSDVTWRSTIQHVPLADFVAREARAADLVVTGPETERFALSSSGNLIVADLVLQAGRPVLIVPPTEDEIDLASVVVTWKDTRESRRAIADALPLLKLAGHLSVVEIAKDDEMDAARGRLADVSDWLRHHGIASDTSAVVSTGEDGAQLRAFAQDRRAGLVVGGAYGHGRLREWTFGGVTRDLLLRPDRCSFVSH